MNNKVLVEVDVPVLEQKYNCFIPIGKSILQVSKLLAKGIKELSDGAYENSCPILYNIQGKKIPIDSLVKDSEITNGTRIIIM